MGIVLKQGKIVTDMDTFKGDIRIEGEKIVAIGEEVQEIDDKVIDVEGCFILPGAIDPHTHFDLDVGSTVTADDFESGTKAAIIGGTTTIIDFATQNRGGTLKEALKTWHKKAENKCYCDYGFHMAISELNKEICREMKDMIDEGVSSFKMYMAYKHSLQVDYDTILRALKTSKEIGALMCFHCEDGDAIELLVNKQKENGHTSPKYHSISRPSKVEAEAVYRLFKISKSVDAPVYIVHLSSKEAMHVVKKAREKGIKAYAETCPHYLLLDDSCYKQNKGFEGAKYIMSPPLRKTFDRDALWDALKLGAIDTIATDHCSFNFKGQKDIGIDDFSKIPNGVPGVEHRLSLIYTYGVLEDKLTMNQMVELISTNVAKIFGIFPQKGAIAVGSDADIVVFDPAVNTLISSHNQTQKVDYTPYEGFKQQGGIKHVFLRGHHVVNKFSLSEKIQKGKYIYRKPLEKR